MGLIVEKTIAGKTEFFANKTHEQRPQHFDQNDTAATTVGSRKIIKNGTIYPSNDANAVGIVWGDYDVTDDGQNGVLVYLGSVFEHRLPVAPTDNAKTALKQIEWQP